MDLILFIIVILVMTIVGNETRTILFAILSLIILFILTYINIYLGIASILLFVLFLILFDKISLPDKYIKKENENSFSSISSYSSEDSEVSKSEQKNDTVSDDLKVEDVKDKFLSYMNLLKQLKPTDSEYGDTLFHIGLLYEQIYQDYFRATGYVYLATVFDNHNKKYEENYLRLCKLLEKNKNSDWVYYITLIRDVNDIDIYANKLLFERKENKISHGTVQHKPKNYYTPKVTPVINSESRFEDFNPESYLHSLGYKVGKSGLSIYGRRKMLKQAIDSGRISKYDVIATLERNVSMFHNRSNMQQSVKDWRDDLYYVRNNF